MLCAYSSIAEAELFSEDEHDAETALERIEEGAVAPEPEPKPNPEYVLELASQAKAASAKLASVSTALKNHALVTMAEALESKVEELLAANDKDLEAFGTDPGTA